MDGLLRLGPWDADGIGQSWIWLAEVGNLGNGNIHANGLGPQSIEEVAILFGCCRSGVFQR